MNIIKLHKSPLLEIFSANVETHIELKFVEQGIMAGFPSPAQDFLDMSIDLNKELIKHPSATFYARVKGNSMQDMGINDGDLLVVDKSLEPANGKVAVCYIDGEFTVKKMKIEKDCVYLIPANPQFTAIKVTRDNEFIVWGIVIHVIKSY